MLILGIIALLIGTGLMVGHFVKSRGADELRGVERREPGALVALVKEIGEELGEGAFRERAEIVGEPACEEPLTSPLGEKPCLYYEMTVTREYEETYYERDSQGNQQRRTRRSSEVVSQEKNSTRFSVGDTSGSIRVHPDGGRYDSLVKSVDRFDKGESSELSVGRFFLEVASQLSAGGGRRTLGYKYVEKILPVDRPLTVIGEVSDEMGQVALRKGEGKLLISTRTREQMIGSAKKAAKLFFIFGCIALGGGVLLVIAGAL